MGFEPKPGDFYVVDCKFGVTSFNEEGAFFIAHQQPIFILDFMLDEKSSNQVRVLTKDGISACFTNLLKINCRLLFRSSWSPPKMTPALLQERFYPDAWKVLVVCLMLNCTQRKQVEPMIETFFSCYPDAVSYVKQFEKNKDAIIEIIRPLGFYNRRADRIYKLSVDFLKDDVQDVSMIHGVGDYANACYEMLFLGVFGKDPPKDHALKNYYMFCKKEGAF